MICVISISHETIIDIALLYAIILTVVGKKKIMKFVMYLDLFYLLGKKKN